jgi:hypothetical protein
MGQMAIGIGRRKFISVLGGVGLAWPLAARAQQSSSKIPVVGVLWHAGSAEEEDVSGNVRFQTIPNMLLRWRRHR